MVSRAEFNLAVYVFKDFIQQNHMEGMLNIPQYCPDLPEKPGWERNPCSLRRFLRSKKLKHCWFAGLSLSSANQSSDGGRPAQPSSFRRSHQPPHLRALARTGILGLSTPVLRRVLPTSLCIQPLVQGGSLPFRGFSSLLDC